jgi:TctA family transporter
MLDALNLAAAQFLQPGVLGLIVIAVPIGLVFGVLPGIGGLTALAILIPFIYGMEPVQGLAFLLAAHAVITTGGSVTSILLGIPGSVLNAATVIDGFALSRAGKAGYAIGAALTASALGGLIGVVVLVTLLPFLQPVVEAFGSPEIFFLALFGIVFIGALGEGQPLKGLIAGALGIFLACFGYQAVTGVPRFWLDFDYLLDGFRLVPMGLGLFAVPQILDLMSKGGTIASMGEGGEISWRQVGRGVLAVCHRWRLLLGSSAIGTLVGIVPGVGGDTATFVAYGWARQASKNPDDFGTGAIEGVIAPEASNNAKEGGSLVPTLAFGVPGSVAMAILLGAFLILGLEPGPYFLVDHLDMALGLAFVVAAANLLGAVIILPVVSRISLLTRVDGQVLGPLLLVLVVLGAYSSAGNPIDVLFVFIFGALGHLMRAHGFSRPSLLLGFVLGSMIETNFDISLNAYGPWFFTRPISLVLVAMIVVGLVLPQVRESRRRRSHGPD